MSAGSASVNTQLWDHAATYQVGQDDAVHEWPAPAFIPVTAKVRDVPFRVHYLEGGYTADSIQFGCAVGVNHSDWKTVQT